MMSLVYFSNGDLVAAANEQHDASKLPSSHFKGVVPQPNGRWGAQIYEKNQRLWLGTFDREEDAAKAYDVAAMKIRGSEAITNFAPLDESAHEAAFVSYHSKQQIIDMLRKHTYDEELNLAAAAVASCSSSTNDAAVVDDVVQDENVVRRFLFHKVMTPSDVGKLNRLVIPKTHAERHFPSLGAEDKGLLLSMFDENGKHWRFRYCYWSSSQSYVLTRGWSRFVKDKQLQVGDVVEFQRESDKIYIDWYRGQYQQLKIQMQMEMEIQMQQQRMASPYPFTWVEPSMLVNFYREYELARKSSNRAFASPLSQDTATSAASQDNATSIRLFGVDIITG